ncbi:hypothetical protein FS749_008490 [Ceratobasidium sp. UAMH 11750]|nr:hypothetical protein FS749_008490 [Ceratobasidium sp. UAMH 11750]
MKHLRGPPPTSCLTCRQRKKKCDRARPSCTRCSEGGFKCLGYERGDPSRASGISAYPCDDPSAYSEDRIMEPFETVLISPQVLVASVAENAAPMFGTRELSNTDVAVPRYQASPSVSQTSDDLSIYRALAPYNYGGGLTPESTLGYTSETNADDDADSYPVFDARYRALVQQTRSGADLRAYRYSLPPKFAPDPQISGAMVQFIISQYELAFSHPSKLHLDLIRGRFLAQMMSSNITRWSRYAGAQVLYARRQRGENAEVGQFVPLIDQLSRLSITAKNDVSLDDMIERLSVAFELSFLKQMTAGATSGYDFMRKIAPLFMQVASADPMLWPRDPTSNGVSLAHALTSPQHELVRFVFADLFMSLIYGTPPLVEYDTSHPISRTDHNHPVGWDIGCYLEPLFSMMKISQWRARHSGGHVSEEIPWREIEKDTLAWRPCEFGPDSESSRAIIKFAIQEGWRHATLIYLYMGMCGVTSHDLRVQASVRQISRLHDVIALEPAAGMPTVGPLLLAAICTQSESDRSKFRAAVSQSQNSTWLVKSMGVAAVLDHLWKGAAANGAPVTWEDYITSRKATIKISV